MLKTTPSAVDRSKAGLASPSLKLLGNFELSLGFGALPLPANLQRIVVLLALRGLAVSRQNVAGTLWPEQTQDRSDANLRTALWRLRRTEGGIVSETARDLRLCDDVQIDLNDAVSLAKRLDNDQIDGADLDAAEVLLSNDVLPDWSEDWLVLDRERFRQLRLHALEALCERLIALRMFGRALQIALTAVAGEPLRESAHRTLVKVHLAEGNRGEALRNYFNYRCLLQDELGVSPSDEMEALVFGLSAKVPGAAFA